MELWLESGSQTEEGKGHRAAGSSEVGALQGEGLRAEECRRGPGPEGDSRPGGSTLAQHPLDNPLKQQAPLRQRFSCPCSSRLCACPQHRHQLTLHSPPESSRARVSQEGNAFTGRTSPVSRPASLPLTVPWKVSSEVRLFAASGAPWERDTPSQLSLNSPFAKLRPNSLVPCLQMQS